MADIPALSFTRPWAELVVGNFKDIENRRWSTRHRGLLLVHAAKSWDGTAIDFAEDVEVELDRELGVDGVSWHAEDHPTGLIGVVDLLDICSKAVGTEDDPLRCGCSPWAMPGQHHWRLGVATRFSLPIPCPGKLGLWAPPVDLRDAIMWEVEHG